MRTPEELAAAIVENRFVRFAKTDHFAAITVSALEDLIARGIRQAVAVYQIQLAQKILAAHRPGELDEEEALIDYILSLIEESPWDAGKYRVAAETPAE
jgi:hypothetical protein